MGLANVGRDLLTRPDMRYQKFTALVIDNNDPEKRQRVKIRIPQIHRNVPDDKLPWTMPMGGGQTNAGAGVGSVQVPPIGAQVFSHFDSDEPHHVYYGSSPTVDTANKDNEILKEDYPDTQGYVDQAGNKVTTNTRQNTILTQHVSGASTLIDGSGNVSIYSPGKLTLSAQGDIIISAGGSIKSHAGGVNSLKGSNIELNGSGSGTSPAGPASRSRPNIPSPSGKVSM